MDVVSDDLRLRSLKRVLAPVCPRTHSSARSGDRTLAASFRWRAGARFGANQLTGPGRSPDIFHFGCSRPPARGTAWLSDSNGDRHRAPWRAAPAARAADGASCLGRARRAATHAHVGTDAVRPGRTRTYGNGQVWGCVTYRQAQTPGRDKPMRVSGPPGAPSGVCRAVARREGGLVKSEGQPRSSRPARRTNAVGTSRELSPRRGTPRPATAVVSNS